MCIKYCLNKSLETVDQSSGWMGMLSFFSLDLNTLSGSLIEINISLQGSKRYKQYKHIAIIIELNDPSTL